MTKFSKIALKILEERYYLKDINGIRIENSPEDLFKRVAEYVAYAEKNYDSGDYTKYKDIFYEAMINQEIMPASPVLFNAGAGSNMLSSCFALPIDDNMDSILKSLRDGAIIFKYGGGVGWNFSKLRQKDSPLSSGGKSSGVCSFISLFNEMIETIKQGGKRRGAGAAILSVDHPDIVEFIMKKRSNNEWNNINISVICTDEFMKNVLNGEEESNKIWNIISESNWQAGDPNIIFIDSMNKYNTLPKYPIDNVNPCHEICMTAYESCNLTGINLDKILKGRKGNLKIDWDKLGKLIKIGHRFLDNTIDMNKFPLPEIEDFAKKTRRQGLYFFGLAPMLIKLGLRYGSQESIDLVDNLFCYINRVSLETCINLGKERGNFPEFNESVFFGKYKYMRCSNRLTIAPSGTTSRIADSYFSIEPYYAFEYESHIMDQIIEEKFSIKDEYKDMYPDALVTAHEISPEEHLRMMATVGKWIDQSVSKTINLPYEASILDVSAIFKLAFRLGLKAVSIYRTGSKGSQVLVEENIVSRSGKKIEVNEEYLKYLYLEKGYAQEQIAEILGISRMIVSLRLKKYNIPIRKKGGSSRYVFRPKCSTIKLLHDRGFNYDEIGKIFNHERDFIVDIMRDNENIGNLKERSIPISDITVEFIEGELLGDGCIMPISNSKETKMAYYCHSSKYYEYVDWLDYIFSSEGLVRSGEILRDEVEFNESHSVVYRYSTIACIELMGLRKKWYDENGKKEVPNSLSFTPTMIRQWFIGDGVVKPDGAIYFCTQSFSLNSLNILKREFKKIGIDDISTTKRNELYIKKRYSYILYEYMEKSYFEDAPCYDYKFIKYRNQTEPIQCKNGSCEI